MAAPASAIAAWIAGASSSPWAIDPSPEAWATTSDPSCTATVIGRCRRVEREQEHGHEL